MFEVSSTLQKAIRRNLEKEALYWAFEIHQSKFDEYLFYRLKVIAMEDIGLATPDALTNVMMIYQSYLDFKERKSREVSLCVAHAVVYLCRCDKCRLTDWALCYMKETHNTHNLKIPDHALDIHTRRGKEAGKGIRDFFETGCKITPHTPLDGENELMEEVRSIYCDLSEDERKANQTCELLPREHPDWSGFGNTRAKSEVQPELF